MEQIDFTVPDRRDGRPVLEPAIVDLDSRAVKMKWADLLLPDGRPLRYIEGPMTTLTTTEIRNFIGGQWASPTSDAALELANPATGEPLGTTPAGSAAEVDAAVQAAHAAFPAWRACPQPIACSFSSS